MSNGSSQKFIERNRPPRVQINCDVETYGSRIKVDLPFIAGVMADLSGTWDPEEVIPAAEQDERGDITKRKFVEFKASNFDAEMKAMRPKVVCRVKDVLSKDPNEKRTVELTFESMDDFSPDKVAEKVEPLKKMLDTRKKLKNLLTYMGNKKKAQQMLKALFENKDVLKSLMAAPNPEPKEKS